MVTKSEDVARAAGVSRATVSQILNGRGARFSAPTRARVLAAAGDLNYRPSIAARALATGSSDIVVALLPYTDVGGNLQVVLEEAAEVLARNGLTLVLRLSTQNPAPLEQLVAQLRPRAVWSISPLADAERKVVESQGPIVISPTELDDGFDHQIGRVQGEHLVSRGYERLAYVHIDDDRFRVWGVPREQGVAEVCREQGLPAPIALRPRLDPDDLLAALDVLPTGTGVACYNDNIAIALLHAAARRGRTVPGDIGLVGMDGTALAAATAPRLSTVSVDITTAALRAVRAMLTALDLPVGKGDAVDPVSPRLIAGASA